MKKMTVISIVMFIYWCSAIFLPSCYNQNLIGPYAEELLSIEEVQNLNYRIVFSYVYKNGEPRLKVEQSFNMPRPLWGIQLPNTFMKKERLYDMIENLQISQGEITDNHQYSFVKLVESNPSSRVVLSYLIRPEITKNEQEHFSSPVIKPEFFQFVGSMGFINPIALDVDQEFEATIEWKFNNDFKVLNSFGAFEDKQVVKTSISKLWDSLFLGGKDFRYQKRIVHGEPVYITFNGFWDKISDDTLAKVVTKLLDTERSAWQDYNFPYFLISFLSVNVDCSSSIHYAGTAHQNSFRAYFPKACGLMPEMVVLIAHELMHIWIGKKIIVGTKRGKIDGKWFSEGLSDYYGRLMSYRSGLLGLNSYFESINRELESYSLSTENETTLSALIDRMYKNNYTNRDLEKLPYQQGELMAIAINKEIKENSNFTKSLDDPMRDLLNIAKNNGGSKNFTFAQIDEVFKRYLPNGISSYLENIIKGEKIIPPSLERCATLEESNATKYRVKNFYTQKRILKYSVNGYRENCSIWLD